MPILLDPSKSNVTIQIMFVEEQNERNGSSKFHFLRSRKDFEHWKSKGYMTTDEIEQSKNSSSQPGMPAKAQPDPNKVIQVLRTWWTRMNWKEQNTIFSRCIKKTGAEDRAMADLDGILYRDMKLKTCLKRWDLKVNGEEVPVSESVIDRLVPEVAQELLNQFELITEATDEELGE